MFFVTGAAGFIGFHTCQLLLKQGIPVVGIDNLNDYYDVSLKEARLRLLQQEANFSFERLDIADREGMTALSGKYPKITHIIHLAAQAGVRYSLINPYAYIESNVMGTLCVMELARHLKNLKHMVYASTSSVYGANTKMPFSPSDRTDSPVALYAASKKATELMGEAYVRMFNLPLTALRYFTVYGPWGRPDMALFIFTKNILEGRSIPVFNHGNMRRNFTYVADIVAGTVACAKSSRTPGEQHVYNIGNDKSESLMEYIQTIETCLGKKAVIDFLPMQPGDVKETIADISASTCDFGFEPKTDIKDGIPQFINWYKEFYKQ